ncbi:Uncharacterized protein Adt_35985 [Abeliophyllum distichum]|uniref:RNase H type-1 domain-containing protein n=1 Tax=Abeliophyllum distichum TaxID=126358 RepID=A0ABD1QG91_9LAMI
MAEQIRSIPITPHVDDQIVWTDTSEICYQVCMAACSYREQYSGCISYDMEFDYSDHGFIFLLEIVAGAYTSGCGGPETDRESYGIETARGIPVSLPGWRFSGQFVSTGHIRTIIPLLILWFIWTARNDAKHRDIAMDPRRIIWRVYHTISLLHTGRLFRHIHWRGDMDIAPIFGVIITTPSHPPPTLVFWRTPPVGSYKINTDGCVKDGFASGGGIIRDSSGQCIRAFFSFYGDCTILEAELRAILDGSFWLRGLDCQFYGWSQFYIGDSLHHQGRRTLAYSGYYTAHQASASTRTGYYHSHLPRGKPGC